jgi:chromosome segregation ATPase
MKPETPAPADLPNLLRQQLILAQVRIMELEDTRDELAPRLAETAALLAEAQSLAELKSGESAHLERVRADLQAQYDHLRHMQHVTNEALNSARAEVASHGDRIAGLLSEKAALDLLNQQLADTVRTHADRIARLEAEVTALSGESAARQIRVNQLDAEQRAMKASRSWRWTSWLRAIERALK